MTILLESFGRKSTWRVHVDLCADCNRWWRGKGPRCDRGEAIYRRLMGDAEADRTAFRGTLATRIGDIVSGPSVILNASFADILEGVIRNPVSH